MKTLRLVLADQLSRSISSLRGIDPSEDTVLLIESSYLTECGIHHKQKLAFVLSAMRHYAEDLQKEKIHVDYVEARGNSLPVSLLEEVQKAILRNRADRLVATEAGNWSLWKKMQTFRDLLHIPVEIRTDDRFICSHDEFVHWAETRKTLRMEHFYRYIRRKTGLLMDNDKPVGNRWNYDIRNRKSLPVNIQTPLREQFVPDTITEEVLHFVGDTYAGNFGDLDSFGWAVTREQALNAAGHFTEQCLPEFGDYQDAMRAGDSYLFHSVLSPYINIGLLDPLETCKAAEAAYKKGTAPLNSVEGFIRQILGWREFVRGMYWKHMPSYESSNFLGADRPLPDFYWTANTDMKCLQETINGTRTNAYAHHIQRLMITGNFALLCGISPHEVEDWYLRVYADAFEWVELPNTHGMALYADGGMLGSKPYAASGSYINRMSDYCSQCRYDAKTKLGAQACPFNYLYWYFLIVNKEVLSSNPRMGLVYRSLARMTSKHRNEIIQNAERFLSTLKTSRA